MFLSFATSFHPLACCVVRIMGQNVSLVSKGYYHSLLSKDMYSKMATGYVNIILWLCTLLIHSFLCITKNGYDISDSAATMATSVPGQEQRQRNYCVSQKRWCQGSYYACSSILERTAMGAVRTTTAWRYRSARATCKCYWNLIIWATSCALPWPRRSSTHKYVATSLPRLALIRCSSLKWYNVYYIKSADLCLKTQNY